jgi:hypothetical protein
LPAGGLPSTKALQKQKAAKLVLGDIRQVEELLDLVKMIRGQSRAAVLKNPCTAATSSSSSSSSTDDSNALLAELTARSPAVAASQRELAMRREEIDCVADTLRAHIGDKPAQKLVTMEACGSLRDKVSGFLDSFTDSSAVLRLYNKEGCMWPGALEGTLYEAVGVHR